MRVRGLVPLLFFAALSSSRAGLAQDLQLLDAGKPVANVPISQFVNGQKTTLGVSTNENGEVTLPLDLLDFGKGEEVQVWVRRCVDGRVEIILARDEEGDPCVGEEARAGERCGCEKIGAFIVGGGPVEIDIGRRTVNQVGRVPGWKETVTFGAKFNVSRMFNLADVAGQAAGATMVEATEWAPGVALLLELSPFGARFRRFVIGVEGTYSRQETETRFGNQLQMGELDYYSLGPYGRLDVAEVDAGPLDLVIFLMAMKAFAWNHGTFELDGVSDDRTHKTWRDEIGGGFYHFSTSRWGFMTQFLYSTTWEDDDADEHWRAGFAVILRPCGNRILE